MELPPLTREQVRSIDRKAVDIYRIYELVLMENAGRGCVETICNFGIQGRVVIVCGKGNNGGDGFVIARHLDGLGYDVHVIWLRSSDPKTPLQKMSMAAKVNLAFVFRSNIRHTSLGEKVDFSNFDRLIAGADWIVDALLGTGATGNPRQPISGMIERLNACSAKKLAVDLPSGLDCDSGIPGNPTFRADHTCTFVAPKVGFANPAAKEFLGTVSVHDIGVPRKLLEEFLPK